ncbi:MAG TPA: helix-turn-helix domain-containing protein [Methylovirgula sp.]|nr:helix-turn-helix domain-containing protein [Methylovirgula sp.]
MSIRLPASILELPLLATPRQAAHLLGLTDGQIRDLIRTGRIAHIMIGKRFMVPRDDIERFIAENRVQPCRDATPGQSFDSSRGAVPGISSGRNEVAAASAARARQIAKKLKPSSGNSSGSAIGAPGRVIRLKS